MSIDQLCEKTLSREGSSPDTDALKIQNFHQRVSSSETFSKALQVWYSWCPLGAVTQGPVSGHTLNKPRPSLWNYVNFLTLFFAIEQVNKDPNILTNITLGYHLYDSCLDPRKAMKSVLQILSGPRKTVPNYSCMDYDKVAGFIGDHYSATTLPIAEILQFYGYSQISYGTTNHVLSDRHIYPHFFRMLQNDRVYYKIIVRLLRHFGWTWVGILASADDNGEMEQLALVNYLTRYDICVDFTIKANMYLAVYGQPLFFENIIERSSAHVIIICGSFQIWVTYFTVLIAEKFDDKVFIFSPPWTFKHYIPKFDVVASKGNLFIELYPLPLPEIGSYFDNINPTKHPNDMLLQDLWILTFSCLTENDSKNQYFHLHYNLNLSNCTGKEYSLNVKDHLYLGVSSRVYYAVVVMALALHEMHLYLKQKSNGNNITHYNYKHKLYHYINKVRHLWQMDDSSLFDEHGEFSFNYLITNWMRIPEGSLLINTVGNFTESAQEDQQLVIDSQSIFWGTMKNQVPRSHCTDNCLPGYRKVPKSGAQVCCYDCTQCPEGEISNRTGRPVDITCMLRQSSFAVIFSIAISSVLGKTVTIYIVFKASKPGSVWSNWISMKVSSSVVLIFSSLQVIINICWLTVSPPFQELDTLSYPGKMIIQCNEGSVIAFYIALGYMGDALQGVAEQLEATSQMTFQNRMALDMILTEKGGVSKMHPATSTCCTFIPDNTGPNGKLTLAIDQLEDLSEELKKNSGIMDPWDKWFGWMNGWQKVLNQIGIVILGHTYFCSSRNK
ncbi:vomeronasal type-2 receptor 26-like [Pelodytes ibericus]